MKLTRGLRLFQPWASEVVNGNLHLLVRSSKSKIRGRVAIVTSKSFDKHWIKKASENEILMFNNKLGTIIGSVEIKECIAVRFDNIKKKLIELGGKKYLEYYPKYLIPPYLKKKDLFIWILEEEKEWGTPKPINGGGIMWIKLNIDDE